MEWEDVRKIIIEIEINLIQSDMREYLDEMLLWRNNFMSYYQEEFPDVRQLSCEIYLERYVDFLADRLERHAGYITNLPALYENMGINLNPLDFGGEEKSQKLLALSEGLRQIKHDLLHEDAING